MLPIPNLFVDRNKLQVLRLRLAQKTRQTSLRMTPHFGARRYSVDLFDDKPMGMEHGLVRGKEPECLLSAGPTMISCMSEKRLSFQGPLSAALRHAMEHLSPEADLPVAATASLESLRTRLGVRLGEEGVDATEVIDDLVRAVDGGIIDSAGPRFFGWVIGGSLPAALAADWLTSVWDQNAGMYACSPAAAVVEEVAGGWLKELLGLPATASFALVTGCQMAHVTCLLAARHALLGRLGWDVEKEGLAGSPPIRILTSTEIHGTTVRAVRMVGLGENRIQKLAADAQGRLREDALVAALESAPAEPTIVVLQAGDLNMGAFDDFAKLIPIAKKFGAWVHVDGAFGLWCGASAKFRPSAERSGGCGLVGDGWA